MMKLTKIFGDPNERELKKYQPLIDATNEFEPEFERLSDEELAAETLEFRQRLKDGESLDDLLPEAFAAVREAAKRTLGQRHFDVQILGGIILHRGKVSEMRTGEGKTLVATLPTYLNALEGKGVHLVTVNDYLARRDAQWMGPVYHLLGLSVACLQHDAALLFDPDAEVDDPTYANTRPISRREAYQADVTYGTNSEFGFDYLRDNMVMDLSHMVQRPLSYCIVDEVDNILIDEARTPLIISGQANESGQTYAQCAQIVPSLRAEDDYTVDEKLRTASLTPSGLEKVEQRLGVNNLYDTDNYKLTHYIDNALKAHAVYKRDREYVVRDGEVIIVDEFTGRLMSGRRYSDGLHQAIEAKEHIKVRAESVTMATVTLQNYFRMYEKLAGMTGTAATEAEELLKIYKVEVLVVPTHRPMTRDDQKDVIYKTENSKYDAIADEIKKLHAEEQPILVGTISLEKSAKLSDLLNRR
ncbi:MAG: preprotein translocase subunit SecA, partial [Chloroflexi bacterium]|nr:preprotein translocase subunit SecA [Chloroflexota bacterium]